MIKAHKSNSFELNNFIVLSGKVISGPKGGLTNSGKFYISFVIASPKNQIFDFKNCNYVPCTMFGDKSKSYLDVFKEGNWIKTMGKINTYKQGNDNKFQILVEDIEVLD